MNPKFHSLWGGDGAQQPHMSNVTNKCSHMSRSRTDIHMHTGIPNRCAGQRLQITKTPVSVHQRSTSAVHIQGYRPSTLRRCFTHLATPTAALTLHASAAPLVRTTSTLFVAHSHVAAPMMRNTTVSAVCPAIDSTVAVVLRLVSDMTRTEYERTIMPYVKMATIPVKWKISAVT